MRASEKLLIRKAIELIHSGDDYMEGMRILCELVGIRYDAAIIKLEPVSIEELASQPNSTFQVNEKL